MLRIGQPPTAAPPPGPPSGGPPPEVLAALAGAGGDPGAPPPDPTADPASQPKYDAEKVPQEAARYLTPDMKCGSCQFYQQAGTCTIVQGKIDPEGVCSIFVSADGSSDTKGQDSDDGSTSGGQPPVSPDGPPQGA